MPQARAQQRPQFKWINESLLEARPDAQGPLSRRSMSTADFSIDDLQHGDITRGLLNIGTEIANTVRDHLISAKNENLDVEDIRIVYKNILDKKHNPEGLIGFFHVIAEGCHR